MLSGLGDSKYPLKSRWQIHYFLYPTEKNCNDFSKTLMQSLCMWNNLLMCSRYADKLSHNYITFLNHVRYSQQIVHFNIIIHQSCLSLLKAVESNISNSCRGGKTSAKWPKTTLKPEKQRQSEVSQNSRTNKEMCLMNISFFYI